MQIGRHSDAHEQWCFWQPASTPSRILKTIGQKYRYTPFILLTLKSKMNIREIGFFERLEELARSQPETTALVCEDKQLKNRELPEIIKRLLNGMLEEGIEKGERVGLLMDNCNEYLLKKGRKGVNQNRRRKCLSRRSRIDSADSSKHHFLLCDRGSGSNLGRIRAGSLHLGSR